MIFHTLYFTILTLDKSQNAQSIVSKMGPLVLPMFGVWIWAVIRSFMWIPVIGLLFAIVLGPRLIFSGVILVKERLKVTECVRQSHARTKGYWGKIVGNLIILGLLIFIAQAVLGGIVSFLPGHKILFVFVSQLVVAFGSVFLVHLALTVMDHPVVVTRVES
jgi:membrane-anchored glycerophosphoryl diester phosphodiesterase (GDPDase)